MAERFLRSLGARLVLPVLAGAVLYFLVLPVALAQTGVEGGLMNRLPHSYVAPAPPMVPAGGAPPGRPRTVEVPPSARGEEEAVPAEEARRTARHRHTVITHYEIKLGAKVLVKKDSWLYSKPDNESAISARIHAGKFANVTGSTRNYVRVKLKDGDEGFVPISAVEPVRPTNKLSKREQSK
jgi:uncharacterized protein YgiM (DUF1202 family)